MTITYTIQHKMLTSNEIRKAFLDFFRSKQHEIVPSAPVVVKDDPTLLFNNSGMAQFKDLFLGTKAIQFPRVADTQKCMRVSGKHNDLEDVGHDTYHHTLFEMLGNWSFGDYYKKEAIAWAWEFLTEVVKIDKNDIYVTVFEGDEKEGLEPDTEALNFWKEWVSEDRILYGNKKDNFWEMGDIGPCGPCSEIHVDCRTEEEKAAVSGKSLVNNDHPQVIEIWNNVFMQFSRNADRSLTPLPAKHVDTGMGFERLCMVLQGKTSTYDTDVFTPTREFLERKTGKIYTEATHIEQVAFRVIMDHIRSICFPIADGQLPSNTGSGYVVRRILRRASRYAFSYLGLNQPFMYEIVSILAAQFKEIFPELATQSAFIQRIVEEEEKNFLRKLESGSKIFEEYIAEHKGSNQIDGDFAFKLYDTFGFPFDLTDLMARERNLKVDEAGFKQKLDEQKDRSRKATEMQTGDWIEIYPTTDLPKFVGYDTETHFSRILRVRTSEAKKAKIYQIVLEETPFYAEGGGQIGDKGLITNGQETILILDTKRENELIVHFVNKLPADASGEWKAEVNHEHRRKVRANHSATHLLHAALRSVLGTHVEQRGSLVTDELLRFDFSHFAKVTDEEIQKVESIVNEKIMAGIPLTEYRSIPIAEAKGKGAMALFGEKYGENVRCIVFDPKYSVELCGGIHVKNTAEIRLFSFLSEGSTSAGIRRVECLTSDAAIAHLNAKAEKLEKIAHLLKNPVNLEKSVTDLLAKLEHLEKEMEKIQGEKVQQLKHELKAQATEVNGIQLISAIVSVGSADALKDLSFELRKITQNTLIVLGAKFDGKPLLSIIMSEDLADTKKYNASALVRELGKEIQGGGGGQPFYATAGGKNPDGLQKALDKVVGLI
jgi:alanyl-tRNA synthetase